MQEVLSAALVLAGVTTAGIGIFIAIIAIIFGIAALIATFFYARWHIRLERLSKNPILGPLPGSWWESEAVFNPAAILDGGKVHLLYRALGRDGISRIGYASSRDGFHFDERLSYPVYSPTRGAGVPTPERVWGPLSYDTQTYASGGGWGGCEDPRIVRIGDILYMTFVAFDGWGFVRMALTQIGHTNFRTKAWKWSQPALLSPPGEIHKNWILFPEKIRSKYAILHSISPDIQIEYVSDPDVFDGKTFIKNSRRSGGRKGFWDNWVRGAGPPPLKTPYGWILLYHAMDEHDPNKYKLGAMVLDLEDPTKVLFRSNEPILSPKEWYENDGKPGVVYSCGAVILGDDLIVYYGAGDKYIAAAKANVQDFIEKLRHGEHAALKPVV